MKVISFKWREVRITLLLISIACLLFLLSLVSVSLLLNIDIHEIFAQFFKSTIASKFGILSMLRRTTYLLIVSLGLAVAFRSSIWNIGGEGQILWGGLMTAAICLTINYSPILVIPLALVASVIAGGFWGFIAGFLKAKWEVNEMLSTLMLNFVALATMIEVAGGPLRDPIVLIAKTRVIPKALQFPYIAYPLNVTFLIALTLIPILYILMERTVIGYKMRVVGINRNAAAYAGIEPKRITMLCMFLSGGICALAGSLLVFGDFFRAESGMTGLYGFYAIVSTILGRSKPNMMFFTSLLIAFMITGTHALRVIGVPGSFTEIVIGMLFIVGVFPELISKLRLRVK